MTESDYIDEIESRWPSGEGESATRNLLKLSEEAVRAFPRSTELWIQGGDLIQMSDETCQVSLDEALECYKRALNLNPRCIDALEAIGFFHDVYRDDFESAENSFRAAIALGGSLHCYAGLARVLQEMGRSEEALELLSVGSCPFHADPHISRRREEIAKGEWAPLDEQ